MLQQEISQIHGSEIILLPKLEVGVLASARYSVFPGISFFYVWPKANRMFNDLSISLQARGVRHIRVDVPDFSLSLVVANAWPFLPASGQMSLHCDWTYTGNKKAPALEFTKTKALSQYFIYDLILSLGYSPVNYHLL